MGNTNQETLSQLIHKLDKIASLQLKLKSHVRDMLRQENTIQNHRTICLYPLCNSMLY